VTVTDLPRWTSRPPRDEQDRAEILGFFTEPDFYFRTGRPAFLAEWEVGELTGPDTRLLLADGQPTGLYATEVTGSAAGCHFSLDLRLRAAAPRDWWLSAYREIVRALRWQQEVIRLTLRFAEYDALGLRAARALSLTDSLTEEGTLQDVLVHDGQRHGTVYFSQTWEPAP
jgi:hypothetical protein